MDKKYDSSIDTQKHIDRVRELIYETISDFEKRAEVHDASKLKDPEKPYFDELTPLLKGVIYGSQEYYDLTKRLGPALNHHYESNSHHPEHYENGIEGMNLLDIFEMFLDWKASSERNKNGDLKESIDININRYNVSPQLEQIFKNTIDYFGW